MASRMVCLIFLLLSFTLLTVCSKKIFKATKIGEGKIQYTGNVGNTQQSRLINCYFECQKNLKCLTFFYNNRTKTCVLHSKSFHYQDPDQQDQDSKMYLIQDEQSRCRYGTGRFLYYRELDLCYNFNPVSIVDYNGILRPTCASYGGKLIRIESQGKQSYIAYVLAGRTETRVGIQGHSFNSWNAWTYEDGTLLTYANWRVSPIAPKPGAWYLQIFTNDEWTEQDNYNALKNCTYICEIK